MDTFIAFIAAISFGSIIAALVGHWSTISNHRQAWINALRDDLAEFFKGLEHLNYVVADYIKDSERHDERRRAARITVLFVYERIRLRLNRVEDLHTQLEAKLREFIDSPLGDAMANRTKINEAVELSRVLLKSEWEVTKYPWKGRWKSKSAK